ncbi:hypothetical protein PROFUN_08360 [Planoprotostelium fungivorum]|uniref:Uncharacterized protein n=1 Tax=Planoprotostelium fungivorum TaxID=1890364 RepID=A0A2P6NI64_9EUKA|nr:hypothetical protein PROFUN_08360 [Planoprotostelium fungivorum]
MAATSLGDRYRIYLTSGDIEWDNREWTVFVQRLLTLVAFPSGPIPETSYRSSRMKVFEDDGTTIHFPCCYLYRGIFTPSANADGLYWKPSRGVVKMGRMLRRYSYAERGPEKMRRQVSYLETCDTWQFIEYRTKQQQTSGTLFSSIHTGETQLDLLVTMVAMDYLGIYPSQLDNQPLNIQPALLLGYDIASSSINSVERKKQRKRDRTTAK